MVVTSIVIGSSVIRINWKEAQDKNGEPLYVEVKYKYKGFEDWQLKLIPPRENSFLLTDIPYATTVEFKLRAVGYSGVFGPVTTKSATTPGRLHSYITCMTQNELHLK